MPLTPEQTEQIESLYQARRNANRRLQNDRRRALFEQIPELRTVEDDIASLSVQEARRRLMNSGGDEHSYASSIADLKGRRAALLARAGKPADYLDPVYDCVKCRDTGYVDGKKCSCYRLAAASLLYQRAGLSDVLEKENFAHFSMDYYSTEVFDEKSGRSARQAMTDVYRSCRTFADHFGESFSNLLLFGPPGVGKTFLSNCIAKELIDRDISVIYASANELFDRLAAQRFSNSADAASHLDDVLDCELLIIDDLGTELTNNFVISELFAIINGRILREKPTVISTNLDLDALAAAYSDRTFSRIISNYKILKLIGNDIRIQKLLHQKEQTEQDSVKGDATACSE